MAHSQTDAQRGNPPVSTRRGTRNQNKQPTPLTLLGQWSRSLVHDIPSQCSAKRLQVEDLRQEATKHAIRAVRIGTVLIAAVVAVVIAATEALTKIVVVVVLVYIIATIAVIRVLIGIRVLIVGTPAILPVCLSGAEAFLVTVVHTLPEQIRAVLIRLVVAAATIVTIVRSRVEVRIIIVIVVTLILEIYSLLM